MKEYIVKLGDKPDIMGSYPIEEQKELVRCKYCKYYPDGKGTTKWLPCSYVMVAPYWFYADGKGKENAHCNSSENPNT